MANDDNDSSVNNTIGGGNMLQVTVVTTQKWNNCEALFCEDSTGCIHRLMVLETTNPSADYGALARARVGHKLTIDRSKLTPYVYIIQDTDITEEP